MFFINPLHKNSGSILTAFTNTFPDLKKVTEKKIGLNIKEKV